MLMEGIIKFFGKVTNVAYQEHGFMTIKMQVVWHQHKGMEETEFSAKEELPKDKYPYVCISYHGPARIDSVKDAAFGFDEKVKRSPYGIGAATDEINIGDQVFVYARWRQIPNYSGESHLVMEEVVVDVPDLQPRPQELRSFVAELLKV